MGREVLLTGSISKTLWGHSELIICVGIACVPGELFDMLYSNIMQHNKLRRLVNIKGSLNWLDVIMACVHSRVMILSDNSVIKMTTMVMMMTTVMMMMMMVVDDDDGWWCWCRWCRSSLCSQECCLTLLTWSWSRELRRRSSCPTNWKWSAHLRRLSRLL